jgi:hypothetical protein
MNDFAGYQSVLFLHPNAMVGFYEFPYWFSRVFKLTTNAQNVAAFTGVNMYVDPSLTDSNYEHLFLTYDIFSGDPTSDPPSNSLFDLTNFQMLVDLGVNTPNIMWDSSLVYGVNFFLDPAWQNLTTSLGLASEQ